jgi:type II secretory pathway component PulC
VWCERADGYSGALETVDLETRADVMVRVVRAPPGRVDAGVAFEVEPAGARVTAVTRLAARAGLQPGDRVVAIDGVSMAGLGRAAMHALAFSLPPRSSARWTVERAGAPMPIDVSTLPAP